MYIILFKILEHKDLPTPAVHLQKFLHHLLQPQQVDELIIGC